MYPKRGFSIQRGKEGKKSQVRGEEEAFEAAKVVSKKRKQQLRLNFNFLGGPSNNVCFLYMLTNIACQYNVHTHAVNDVHMYTIFLIRNVH